MKKFILILVVISLLAGCSPANDREVINIPEGTNQNDTTTPITTEKTDPGEIIILSARYQYTRPDVGYVWEWQEYMRNKNNIDIELIMTPRDTDGLMSANDIIHNNISGGFVYVDRTGDLINLIDSGAIIPVNDFIGQIPSVSVLNDKLLEQFADSKDNIWGIPLSHYMATRYRIYNNDWIKKWGKKQPSTIDEYLDFAYYVRDNDLDGNGKSDSYISAFSDGSLFYEFEDVFRAFGCYVNSSQAVEYNPEKDKYEIILLNENFKEAFSFIKLLYDEGLIIESDKSLNNRYDEPYNVATAVSPVPLQEYKSLTTGYYLLGNNKTNLIRYKSTPLCLAILPGTENVPEKIEYLFNKIAENQDCAMDFSWGIEGKSYQSFDEYYMCSSIDKNGDIIPRINIRTTIGLENYEYKPTVYQIDPSDISDEYIESYVQSNKITQAVRPDFTTLYDNEMTYTIKYLLFNREIREVDFEIRELTNKTITAMLKSEVTIEDGLAQYRNELEKMGIIDKMNDAS